MAYDYIHVNVTIICVGLSEISKAINVQFSGSAVCIISGARWIVSVHNVPILTLEVSQNDSMHWSQRNIFV